MNLVSRVVSCPHCGHNQHVHIDTSLGDQEYYDDCRVCCNSIHMRLHVNDSNRTIQLFIDSDNEQLY